jgi:hypothetical protein
LSSELLLIFIPTHFHVLLSLSDECFMSLCKAWLDKDKIQTTLAFIQEVEKVIDGSSKIKESSTALFQHNKVEIFAKIALKLVKNKKYAEVNKFFLQYLKTVDIYFVGNLLDELITENQLVIAHVILTSTTRRADTIINY